jgi:hypothetical protein
VLPRSEDGDARVRTDRVDVFIHHMDKSTRPGISPPTATASLVVMSVCSGTT